MSPAMRMQYKHIIDGATMTKGEIHVISKRLDQINEAADLCDASKDFDVLQNLHIETSDLLEVLELSLSNIPTKEKDL